MSTEFKLPELGENVASGDVINVLVSPGDMLDRDQPVLELETDKATIEVPSTVAGRVQEVRVRPGDKVNVGQVILTVADGAEEAATPREPAAEPRKPQEAPPSEEQDISRQEPEAAREAKGEADEEEKVPTGGLRQHARADSEQPESEVPEPEMGTVQKVREAEAEASKKGRRGEVVEISRGPRAGAEQAAPRKLVPAAPSVRRVARELGIDISQVSGSGPAGRISADDVKAYAREAIAGAAAAGPQPARVPQPGVLPDFSKWGPVERVPMRSVRRKTAQHLAAAWAAIPHVTQHDTADVTELERLRERFNPRVERAGGKLTVTAILLKVVAGALKAFPQFASSVDMDREEIIQKQYFHVGVAVDTDRGLLVPVIRDVDKKNIVQLAAELTAAAEKARNRKITLEEMEAGVFTITNLGGIGGTHFSPIVNLPEVAILGVSRARLEGVYRDGAFQPRLMLPLSLSYDHRVIDGADAIRFVRWIVDALEQPFLLSLEG